jgi:hypothetical protein
MQNAMMLVLASHCKLSDEHWHKASYLLLHTAKTHVCRISGHNELSHLAMDNIDYNQVNKRVTGSRNAPLFKSH